jgi:predicted dehydrogenase
MPSKTRREFMANVGAGVAATAVIASPVFSKDKSDSISVGLIGCGSRGPDVANRMAYVPGVAITHVCDPHQTRLAAAARQFSIQEGKVVSDMRRVFDDQSVDAVLVATPDHWHAPAAILACNAGKHVYVEKPCSHNIREGRLLVAAARRNNRVVQHGTQVRSTPMMIEATQLLREGIIGDVLVAKAWNIQQRGPIGRQQPSNPPQELDYDLWTGPVPTIPYQDNRVGGWHWWYHFGTGDMGNDGIHDLEYARWGLGVESHPYHVAASGGKYFFDDDQEFPDTQHVSFEFPEDRAGNKTLIYEQRLWSTNYPHNTDSGAEFYGTKGQMYLSRRGKVKVLGERNGPIDVQIETQPQDTDRHVADFFDAIRNDRRPNADIELGHMTATLCHLGNIATRLRESLQFDPQTEQITNKDDANRLVQRQYRDHWGVPV